MFYGCLSVLALFLLAHVVRMALEWRHNMAELFFSFIAVAAFFFLFLGGFVKGSTTKRLHIILCITVYGFRMPIYGSILSKYGKNAGIYSGVFCYCRMFILLLFFLWKFI